MFYNMDKSKPIRSTRCVNITNRVDFSNKILRNVLAYYPYKIKENEKISKEDIKEGGQDEKD